MCRFIVCGQCSQSRGRGAVQVDCGVVRVKEERVREDRRIERGVKRCLGDMFQILGGNSQGIRLSVLAGFIKAENNSLDRFASPVRLLLYCLPQ